MGTGPRTPSSTARDPADDDDPARPRPGAEFLKAVADYVKASRRFAAAKKVLLVHVDAFESQVRAAAGTATDDASAEAVPGDPSALIEPADSRLWPLPSRGWPSHARSRGRGGRTRP